jgi:chemotaxis protein MotB
LFKPGEARIPASAEASFDTIGRVLSRYPNHILLEGHTDSVPIHNAHFQSNWELSTARSMAVMELLERRAGMPSSRFSIGGSADNSPYPSTAANREGRETAVSRSSFWKTGPARSRQAELSSPFPE